MAPSTPELYTSCHPLSSATLFRSGKIVGRHRDAFRLAFENAAERLARQTRDLALERTHAGFAGVIADEVAQPFVGQLEFAGLQTVRLDLLRDQVQLGDLDLLVLGIAFEPDDLHAVEQRLRQVERVRGGDEHDVAEVDIDLQIMILELAILFGVENLEQRRSRTGYEILRQLVDLGENTEQRAV